MSEAKIAGVILKSPQELPASTYYDVTPWGVTADILGRPHIELIPWHEIRRVLVERPKPQAPPPPVDPAAKATEQAQAKPQTARRATKQRKRGKR